MLVGLQGSGKTTTAAKLAKRFSERQKKKVLMASLDTRRPAAQEQLRVLGEQVGVATLPIVAGQTPVEIANRAMTAGRLGGYDVVMLDTAGRTHIDEPLMLRDGGDRGGHASARDPARRRFADRPGRRQRRALLLGARRRHRHRADPRRRRRARRRGAFDAQPSPAGRSSSSAPARRWMRWRISIPAASPTAFSAWATSSRSSSAPPKTSTRRRRSAAAQKLQKGEFDLEDLADQLRQMQKIGGMSGILGMMPGIGKMKKQIAAAGLDDKILPRQLAIISSMTKNERHKPALMNASRKRRVASGSGTEVQDVNKLLKMHRQMSDMMKKLGRGKGGLGALFGMGGGAMPQPDPAMLEQLQKGGLGGLPGGMAGGIGGLPPFPGGQGFGMPKLPGMGGSFPGLGKKK